MKFTSEDLMKAMGLKIGDRVKTKDNFIFEIVKNDFYFLKGINIPENRGLEFLIGLEVDIVPRPKRVGDLKCEELGCMSCPIQFACKMFSKNPDIDWDCGCQQTRYITLDLLNIKDQEIYNLLKARLDKEVEENGNMDTQSR